MTENQEKTSTKFKLSTRIIIAVVILLLIAGGFWLWTIFNTSIKQGQLFDYLEQAEVATENGDYRTAFEYYQKAQELEPENNLHTIKQADVAFLNGDYKIAALFYKQVGIEGSAEIKYYEALELLSELDFTQARIKAEGVNAVLDRERPLTQEDVTDLVTLLENLDQETNQPLQAALSAKFLIEQNALDLAEKTLTSLTEKEPDYRDAHYLLGVNYLKQGQTEDARASLDNALKIDPNYQPALEILKQLEN